MVDNSNSKYLEDLEMHDSYSMMHCYHFESLSTTVREYKTLKQMEFCMMAPILLQPTLSLQKKQEMISEHKRTIDEAWNDPTIVKPVLSTRKWGSTTEKVVDIYDNMRKYFAAN